MELTETCIIGKGKIMKIAFPLKSGSRRCNGVPLSALTLHSKVCSEKREGTPSGSNRGRSRREWIDDGIRTCLPKVDRPRPLFSRRSLLSVWFLSPPGVALSLTFEVDGAALHQAVPRHASLYHWRSGGSAKRWLTPSHAVIAATSSCAGSVSARGSTLG